METSANAAPRSAVQPQITDLATGHPEADDQLAAEHLEMSLPHEPRTVFLGILCAIAVLACLYIAQDIVLPVVLAVVLKLLLQPLVSTLERVPVPKAAGALIALAVLVSVFVGLGMLLSSPTARWASELPHAWPQLQQKFAFIKDPVEAHTAYARPEGCPSREPIDAASNPIGMVTAVFSGTGTIAAHLLETLLVLLRRQAVNNAR